jgi:hypothetical protein
VGVGVAQQPDPLRLLAQVHAVMLLQKADAQESRPVADVLVEGEDRPSHQRTLPKPRHGQQIPERMPRRPTACLPAFPRL